ncbi:hypothetical protein CC86DRAFT_471968 [Ophiobolus disseminans]|uniref:Uncharacterized protein n=1 Tax=Ophiobolus disseminans TaxID=1469910 RepID=A0A6A6ZGX5_9PLEO|nr:hypothetical protein CC86DRAFT_471968 [Ophiobolus disseminans]
MSEVESQLPVLAGNWEELSGDAVEHIQLAALRVYLAGNNTADECSQKLTATIPKAMIDGTAINDENDSEDDYDAADDAVFTILNTLQHTALTNPQHQAAIVALLQALQRLPPQRVHAPTLRRHEDKGPEDIDWSVLRNHFTPNLTDTYEYQRFLFGQSPTDEATITKWAIVNAWIARLVSTDMYGPGGLDYYMHRASYCFLRVLDVEGHPNFHGEVPATANLFRYASPVLLRLCREKKECPGPPIGIYAPRAAELGEGRKLLFTELGYSMERWEWWKTRWGQLVNGEEVDGGVRAHARDALEAMEGAERMCP